MIKIAQIGCGYWGPNLIRNFNSIGECELTAVVEPSEERRAFVEKSFSGLRCDLGFDEVITDPSLDALIIATPANLHFEQTKQALLSGKHVLVEKPMATKLTQAQELADIAQSKGLILMSGHTFLYNDAVRFIKNEIDSGNLGQIRYLYSQRLNLGRIRSGVNALWNFAPTMSPFSNFCLVTRILLKSIHSEWISSKRGRTT